MRIIAFHRYGEKSHFKALGKYIIEYISCDPIIILAKVIRRKYGVKEALKRLSLMLKCYFTHPKADIYIYGFAPESAYFIILCIIWMRRGRRVLFTSFSDDPRKLSRTGKIIFKSNAYFAKIFFNSCAAVSLSAQKNLSLHLKTYLVEHSVDVKEYKAHPSNGRLIYLGRVAEYKNVNSIITSASRLDVGLDIVGPLESKNSEMGKLPDNIFYLGQKDKKWIKDNIGKYAALVIASDYREPFGIVILEAMAAGIAVIASRTNGTETIFRNWPDYPFMFDSNDSEGLSSALRRHKESSEEELLIIKRRLSNMASLYSPAALSDKWMAALH